MRIKTVNDQARPDNSFGRPIDVDFIGPLILSGDPTENRDAATKRYVDQKANNFDAGSLTNGVISVARLPAFSGDVTNVAGTNAFTLNPTGVTPGTTTRPTVDVKGRVIGSGGLSPQDVPNLDWSIITTGKPTTAEGYGIIDAIKLTGDTVTGGLRISNLPTDDNHAATRRYVNTIIGQAGSLIPSGTIVSQSSNEQREGYLRANGAQLRVTDEPMLFEAIGNKFGTPQHLGAGMPWVHQYGFNDSTDVALTDWRLEGTSPLGGNPRYGASNQLFATKNKVYEILVTENTQTVNNPIIMTEILPDGSLTGPVQVGTFAIPVRGASALVVGDYVHIFGGSSGTAGTNNNIHSAKIHNDGSLGTWFRNSLSLPKSSFYPLVFRIGNFLYIGEGTSISSSNVFSPSTGIHRSRIYPDGGLGQLEYVNSIPINVNITGRGLTDCAVFVTKSRVYVAPAGREIMSAPVYADNSIGAWTLHQTLPWTVLPTYFFITNSRAYLMAGYVQTGAGFSVETRIFSAPVDADGNIGQFVSIGNTPTSLGLGASVIGKDRVYFFGSSTNGLLNYSAKFKGVGSDFMPYFKGEVDTLGQESPRTSAYLTAGRPWIHHPDTPSSDVVDPAVWHSRGSGFTGFALDGAFVTKSRVYSIGSTGVRYSNINSNGTLGTPVADTSLPVFTATQQWTKTVVYKNNVFVFGKGPIGYRDILRGSINSSGHLTSLEKVGELNYDAIHCDVVLIGNIIYVIGGNSTNDIQKVIINENMSVTVSASTGKLPRYCFGGTVFIAGKYLYILGGHNNGYGGAFDSYSNLIRYTITVTGDLVSPIVFENFYPEKIAASHAYVMADKVYFFPGKALPTNYVTKIYSADISPEGDLSNLTLIKSLPSIEDNSRFTALRTNTKILIINDITGDVSSITTNSDAPDYSTFNQTGLESISEFFNLPDYSYKETKDTFYYVKK